MAIRVFISHPMRDRTRLGIEQERRSILDWLSFTDIIGGQEIVEIPMLPEWQALSSPPVYSLGRSIQALSCANLVVFGIGWEKARGCIVEHEACVQYDIPYIELDCDDDGAIQIVARGKGVDSLCSS